MECRQAIAKRETHKRTHSSLPLALNEDLASPLTR